VHKAPSTHLGLAPQHTHTEAKNAGRAMDEVNELGGEQEAEAGKAKTSRRGAAIPIPYARPARRLTGFGCIARRKMEASRGRVPSEPELTGGVHRQKKEEERP